jgi:hypothetical protein
LNAFLFFLQNNMNQIFENSFTFKPKDLRRRATQVSIRLGMNPKTDSFLNRPTASNPMERFTQDSGAVWVFALLSERSDKSPSTPTPTQR